MTFRKTLSLVGIASLVVAATALAGDHGDDRWGGYGGGWYGGHTYTVTITNLTGGQVFSPPVVASHNHRTSLFTPGQPASDELAQVAEDAYADPLIAALVSSNDVFDVTIGPDVIPPGQTMSVDISARGDFPLVSLVGMLVTTNDAFYAVQDQSIWGGHTYALAWDAGSEGDSEDCAHIPGPPCGNAFVANDEGAEGFVYVDRGIHGIADLDPAVHDWRNPVALVTIARK